MADDPDTLRPGYPAPSIPLEPRRAARADGLRQLPRLVPAAALLFTGMQSLLAHARGLGLSLALLELAFGGLLLRSGDSPRSGPGLDGTAILAAGVLAAELIERWRSTGRVTPITALLAGVTLFLGVAGGRIHAARQRSRNLAVQAKIRAPEGPGLTPIASAGTLRREGESK